mgnify:CR=1 FL=1
MKETYAKIDKLYKSSSEIDLILSYSRISDFAKNGPKALIKRSVLKGVGIYIGSLVDDLLLDEESFDDKYLVYNGSRPTATLGKLADIILDNYNEVPTIDKVVEIAVNNKFWSKYAEATLIKTIDTPDLWEYLNAQLESRKRTLITTDDLLLANDIKDALLTHDFSRDIFINNFDNHNQVKFVMKYKDFKIRGILDRVIVNHKDKTVRFIDLKTGANPVEEFENSFIKFKYYFQAAIYTKAFDVISKDLGFEGYTLLPFEFLYIGRYQKIPLLYEFTDKWNNAAINGFKKGPYTYTGLNHNLDLIKWHYDNREFELSKFIKTSNGRVKLNDNHIDINNN